MNNIRKLSMPMRLFLLALILRLIPVLMAIDLPIGLDDMFQYDMLGRSLAEGNGFRWYAQEDLDLIRSYFDLDFVVGDYDPQGVLASFRAPAYPAFLAIIYSISGLANRFLAARLVQALLGASIAPLAYAIARHLFPKSKKGALISGLIVAAYPMLVIYPLALATENLFMPLVFAAILMLLKASQNGRARSFIVAGLLLGFATLTRSVIFGFAGLAFLWIFFAVKDRRAAIFFLLALMLVVTPWVIRNSLLHEKFTFVENSLGYNLHMGYHPEGQGTFQYGISLELFPYLDDGLRNDLGVEAGLSFIRDDPDRIPQLMLNKLGFFMGLERRALSYFYSNGFFGVIPLPLLISLFLLFTLPFVLTSISAVIAMAFSKWTKEILLFILLVLGYLFPHVLLLAEPRFHLAIVPALAIFTGYAIEQRRQITQAARSSPWKSALVLALILLLCLNWGMELTRDADALNLLFGPDGYRAGFSY